MPHPPKIMPNHLFAGLRKSCMIPKGLLSVKLSQTELSSHVQNGEGILTSKSLKLSPKMAQAQSTISPKTPDSMKC
jgi:hypothetical protein